MAPFSKNKNVRLQSREKKNRNNRRRTDAVGLSYEQFEPRMLLAATFELSPLQQQVIFDYIAATPETAYLQLGANDLQFIAADTEAVSTTALFQQTVNGIAVQDAFVTVLQQDGQVLEVFDRGFENLAIADGTNPVVSVVDAEMIADHSLGDRDPNMSSELVWYHQDGGAELTWQVSTFLNESTDLFPTADFITYVDADSGVVLEQETPFELVEYLLEQPDVEVGEYGRIVINNGIGASGSRAYAAPFDSVVEVGGCTGTLISPNTILTARHCGAGAGTQVRFGDNGNGPTFTVQSSFLPDGNGSLLDGGDVAILTLTSNVPSSVATPMRLIGETSSLVGSVAATVGYGYNGLGSSGHGFTADGFRWGGENIIDRYGSPAGSSGSNIFSTDFDNGSSGNNTISGSDSNPLNFEATTAPGDSGGPILVQVGSEWVIAGVLSGGTTNTSVYGDISWWTGIADYQSSIEARGGVFVGSGAGSVAFDSNSYQIDDTFTVTVTESNAMPPISVTIVSDSGDTETLVLSGSGSTYTSSNITISDNAVSANDGILQASAGDQITVTYTDPDDGSGSSSVETDTATILDLGAGGVLVGIDFDLSSGSNPQNWQEISTGGNATFSDLNDEQGNPTAIDFTINETPNGSWTGFEASINASTLPQHSSSLANLNGQIYNGADTFALTYSDLDPLANYEIYVFGLEGFFSSIQQRVTIDGDGPAITFDQNFNQNDLFINDQLGSSSRALAEYAQVVTADSSGNININITPLGGTDDVVLGGIAIAAVVEDAECDDLHSVPIGATNRGVAVADNATGSGYIMYSEQNVFTRFGDAYTGNATNLIAVRLSGSQWQYNNNTNWVNFTAVATDRLLAEVNFSADTVTSLQGTSSTVSGIDAGYGSGDITITANIWNGGANPGEFGVTGTFFSTGGSGSQTNIGATNRGVAVADNATGSGYIMYSEQNVFTRFGDAYTGNATNLIAVRLSGSQWQYNNNTNWVNFTADATDRLLAEVDFSADSVTSLRGTSSTISGIDAGYDNGDISITANIWNGGANPGEFGISGSFFAIGGGGSQTTGIGATNRGVAVTDNATGSGYIMYSEQNVFARFGDAYRGNATNLIAVRLSGSQWQYNNNTSWVNFTPNATDRLLAEVSFSADTVTSLEGTVSTISGIDSGYDNGDITITANIWNGIANPGEFRVTGTFFEIQDCDEGRHIVADQRIEQSDKRENAGQLFANAENLGTSIDFVSPQPESVNTRQRANTEISEAVQLSSLAGGLQSVFDNGNELEVKQRDRAFADFGADEPSKLNTELEFELLDLVSLDI